MILAEISNLSRFKVIKQLVILILDYSVVILIKYNFIDFVIVLKMMEIMPSMLTMMGMMSVVMKKNRKCLMKRMMMEKLVMKVLVFLQACDLGSGCVEWKVFRLGFTQPQRQHKLVRSKFAKAR